MNYLKRFTTEADYQSFKGGDFITPNVSAVEETLEVHYNPKDTSVAFYIENLSFTIPHSMTWREAINSPNLVICNSYAGNYGHYFDSKQDMHCGVDNTLYYIPIYENEEEVEVEGYVYQDNCIDCVHLGGVGCLEQITNTLVNDDNTPVLLDDKIKPFNYKLVLL